NSKSITVDYTPLSFYNIETNSPCNPETDGYISVTVTGGTPPYLYHWENEDAIQIGNENDATLSDLGAGTYYLTVIDDTGCEISTSHTIFLSMPPEIEINNIVPVCYSEAENGSAQANVTNGFDDYSYLWSSGETTQTATQLTLGTNWVTVNDSNGCSASASVEIGTSDLSVEINPNNLTLCLSNVTPTDITAFASGGEPPYTYTWDNGLGFGATQTVSPTTNTTYTVTVTDSHNCTATTSVAITIIDMEVVIKKPYHDICIGFNTRLDAMGGPGNNLTYQWSPSESLDNPNVQYPYASPVESTTYTVTVTDQNGCWATGEVHVEVHPIPIITVSAPDVVCAGYEIQLEAFGAVTYHWETSSTTAIISNTEIANPTVIITEPTTFTVSGWSEFWCKGFAEITINVLDNPPPILEVITSPICNSNQLNINILNQELSSTYTWIGPNGFSSTMVNITIDNVTEDNEGFYSVMAQHINGCQATAETYVQVLTYTLIANNNFPCEEETLELLVRPAIFETYEWEGPNNFYVLSEDYITEVPGALSNMSGTYYVTATDAYGCTATGQTEVIIHENPEVNLGDDVLICSSESVELGQNLTITGGTPDYSYEWEPVDWLNNYLIQNPIATPQTTTTYTLTVTDNHGCTGSDAITVAVDQIVGLTATYNTPVCQYTQLQLFAQPDGVDYLWTGPNGFTSNEQNPIVTTTASMLNIGTYTLIATNANNCSSTISIEVEIHSVPEVAIGGNPTVCEGNTLALIGGIDGLAEYHWTGPNGFVSNLQNPIVSTNASTDMEGNYILTVTNEFGCTASAVSNVEVIPIPQAAEFSLPSCIYIDNNYLFTNLGNNDDSFEYTWDFGDETISNQASPNHTFLNQGYHCITLTVENQCGISSYTPPKPVFLYPNECACITNYGLDDNLFITGSDEFWDPTINTVKKDIIIEPDAKLTIDGQTIQFGPEGRIIVKPKGELFINNSSTLQGLESCNNMWQGIEVWGNPMYESESSEQGRVKVDAGKNKIKDAHIGILVGARNMDNICDFDLLSAFNSEYSGGYIGNKQSLNFINNGIGIKLLKKYPGGYPGTGTDGAYQMMSFETESGGLLDLNYNSVSGASPYPNIHNPWAGKANSLQRTDAGIWMEGIKFYKLYNSKFTNVQYGILAYNSCLNVIKTNFDNAVYGVRIENSNSELNSGYNIEGCEFKNIIGTGDDALEDFTSAGIFINSNLNTEIHGNIFGIEESPQSENNIGIFTLNSLSMNIYQNKFKNMKKGIFTSNIIITSIFPLMVDTDLPTNKIGAGLKTYYDITGLENWDGNSFEKCNTSVYTYLFNTNLILKCNNCKNDDVNLGAYYVNFKNEGFMANIGAPPPFISSLNQELKRPGGNEFTPDYPFYNGFYKTIMSNTEYEYYAHQGPSKVIPTSHFESNVDMANHIHTSTQQKPENKIACSPPIYIISFPVSLPLVIVEPNGAKNYPYKYLDSLKNNIDSLSFVREDIRQNLDNGKTQELLNDIYGNMSNGRLKNKLIANSPLSDTVLYALMSEYPLSHGNFKNVMT
ncbi:MAG: PKD domain-containing protein, partial [Blautia sp.]